MNHHFEDIRSRIAEEPQWWDEHAVPRYCPFAPNEVADIYAVEVALVRIECQACGTAFKVAFSWGRYVMGRNEDGTVWCKTHPPIDPRTLHYGDPPNAGCCASGPTMNSEPQRVLEWWRRDYCEWQRVPENEVAIGCCADA